MLWPSKLHGIAKVPSPREPIIQTVAAAKATLAARWATGEWWLRRTGAIAGARFAFDMIVRRCACVTGYLMEDQAQFWVRTINAGNDLYLPLTKEMAAADPQETPGHVGEWIKLPGTYYPSSTPVAPLYWLQGAVSGVLVGPRRVRVRASRDESIAAAAEEEREQIAEAWDQLGFAAPEEYRNLTYLDCTVEFTDTATINSVEIQLAPGHTLEVEYQTLGQPIDIPLPDDYESVPLTKMLAELGVPDLVPPRIREGEHSEPDDDQ